MALGTFISVGRSLDTALERVQLAEKLGYESVYVTHIASRDSLTTLMAYASRTERVRLGTGVMPIYSRPPVTTAMSAATADEFSGGRIVLGLGVSHRPVVEGWFDQRIDKPVREMREYVGIVRAILRGEDPPRARSSGPASASWASTRRDRTCPIYVAGLSPGMLRLAGEIARRRDPLALQPQLRPRLRGPRGDARAASARARTSTASTSSPRCRRR